MNSFHFANSHTSVDCSESTLLYSTFLQEGEVYPAGCIAKFGLSADAGEMDLEILSEAQVPKDA